MGRANFLSGCQRGGALQFSNTCDRDRFNSSGPSDSLIHQRCAARFIFTSARRVPFACGDTPATRQPLCHTGRDSCHSVKFRPWLFLTAAGRRVCRVLVQSVDTTECLLKSFQSTLGRNSLKKKFIHLKKTLTKKCKIFVYAAFISELFKADCCLKKGSDQDRKAFAVCVCLPVCFYDRQGNCYHSQFIHNIQYTFSSWLLFTSVM